MAVTDRTRSDETLVKDWRHFIPGQPSIITPETWEARNALAERYYPHVYDLMRFDEWHIVDILIDVEQDRKPNREFPIGPGPRPIALLPRRSWLEWHLFRGIAPVARRAAIPGHVREAVIRRDGYVCGICAEAVDASDVHLDHIKPRSKGGSDAITNLQVAHSTCNLRKGAKFDGS